MIAKPDIDQDERESDDEVKIYYCSRTHSQLTQFANEVRRVRIPSQLTEEVAENHDFDIENPLVRETKYLTLGSRKNLCINSKVSRLGNATAINEKCLELQHSSTPLDHKCTFLPNKENEHLVNEFRDHTLASVRDIEDLGKLGKGLGVCPYYASRAAIKPSEVGDLKLFMKLLINIIEDYHPTLLVTTTEECKRSLGHLSKGSCYHH